MAPTYKFLTISDRRTIYRYIEVINQLYQQFDIPLFAIGGTLLGAIREQDVIEWDDDIDYGIIVDHMYQLEEKRVLDYLNERGFLLCKKRGMKYEHIWHLFKTDKPQQQQCALVIKHRDYNLIMKGIHPTITTERNLCVDIFGYEAGGDDYCLRINGKLAQAINKANLDSGLQMYQFGNTTVNSLKEPICYLNKIYGDWHQIKIYDAHRQCEMSQTPNHLAYVIGVFDLLHSGHYNLFYRLKNNYSRIIVGVCNDQLVADTKHHVCLYDQNIRKQLISKLDIVDQVIIYDDLDQSKLLLSMPIDVFVVPPDYGYLPQHSTNLDLCNRLSVQIIRSERTDGISSTQLRKTLQM